MSATDPFEAFSKDVRQIHTAWTLWRHLFNREHHTASSAAATVAAGDEAYRLTGAASRLFFSYARWYVLKGAVVDLCRLCDPKEMSGRRNLTVERILDETDLGGAPPLLAQEVRLAKSELDRIVGGELKLLRNKVLAHNDLDVATGEDLVDVDIVEAADHAVRRLVQFQHLVATARDGRPFSIQTGDALPDRSVEAEWRVEVDRLLDVLRVGLGA